jgi:hypothetical protein
LVFTEQKSEIFGGCNKNGENFNAKITSIKTKMMMKNVVFWDVGLCRSCVNQRFGGTYRLHLPPKRRLTQDLHSATSQKYFFCPTYFDSLYKLFVTSSSSSSSSSMALQPLWPLAAFSVP